MDKETIYFKKKISTPQDSFESFLDSLFQVYKEFSRDVKGIAISMPSLIDSDSGYAIHGGSLKYIRNTNLLERINKRLSVPVSIENDGKSAALGESWKGGLKNINDGVAFVIGTGIGGGIILNGKLVKGHNFGAGEFSYIRTDGKNPVNTETYFGLNGSATNLVKTVAIQFGFNQNSFSGEDMFEEIRNGNKEVLKLFQEYCKLIAGQIMNLQAILDPEVFIIGGGMSADFLLVREIEYALENLLPKDFSFYLNGVKPKIIRSELGNNANLYGALYQYYKKYLKDTE